jgi:formylglycine-generating enzyme required for sulfatase activity
MKKFIRTFSMLVFILLVLYGCAVNKPRATNTPQAVQGFTDDHGVAMVVIPGGAFMMGSAEGYENEAPVHEVWLDEYAIDVYEVTNEQYARFLNAQGNREEGGVRWYDASSEAAKIRPEDEAWVVEAGFERHPVVKVSWYGAQAYCAWRGGRLPTEAEWERAARGGLDGGRYPWGDENPTCGLDDLSGANYRTCGEERQPVGSYTPNGFGLYDMAGNVWEWTADWYAGDYYLSASAENPIGPLDGTYRVLRGGSYQMDAQLLRVAWRGKVTPDNRDDEGGFRCVR